MSHHTDLAGSDALVAEAQRDLELVLRELRQFGIARNARDETTRNALRELVAATRRNDPLKRCIRTLAGAGIGEAAKTVLVMALLRRLQREALEPVRVSTEHKLPAGVHTPVTSEPPLDPDRTPIPAAPVNALEVDVTLDGKPTTPLAGKPTQGPWGALPPTKPLKPRRS